MRLFAATLLVLSVGCEVPRDRGEGDLDALVAAIAVAEPGSRLSIPRDVYRIGAGEPIELTPPPGLTIDGNGAVWLTDGRVVRVVGSERLTIADLSLRDVTLRFEGGSGLTLRNVRFAGDGRGDDDDQLRLSHLTGAAIERCTFRRPQRAGRSLQIYRSHDVRVADSSWQGRLRTAINVFGAGGAPTFPDSERNTAIAIVGNRIERSPGDYSEDHGIYAWGVSGMTIRDNLVRGWSLSASGGAVKLRNGDDVRIVDNRFLGSGVLLYTYADAGAPPWLRDVTLEGNRIDLRRAAPGRGGRLWERRAGISYWRNFRSNVPVERSIRIVDNEVIDGTISILGVTDRGAFQLRGNR